MGSDPVVPHLRLKVLFRTPDVVIFSIDPQFLAPPPPASAIKVPSCANSNGLTISLPSIDKMLNIVENVPEELNLKMVEFSAKTPAVPPYRLLSAA